MNKAINSERSPNKPYEKIDEANESKEVTINAAKPNDSTPPHINKQTLAIKRDLVRRFYVSRDVRQRKSILSVWPNPTIQSLLSKHGILQLPNNSYLVGGITNNLIQGPALLLYSPTRFYQGTFQNNFKHGHGLQHLPNGLYYGHFTNNKPQGRGCFHWNNDQIYEGEFLGGMKHGSGRWTSKNETYVGEWKGNKPEGLGVIVTHQSRYEGEVRAGLKHGHGREVFTNGDGYTGGYVNGRMEGVGEYTWGRNRAQYKGWFKNGLRHGDGVWVQGGDRYQGHYLNDRKNGNGTFTWASGNHYTGSYFDDMRHGYGEMHWADSSWYKGEWKYGVQHGMGQTFEVGQPARRGLFQNNVLICEEDVSKKLKMDKIHKKFQNFRNRNYTNYDVKMTKLPQQHDFNKKLPSFTVKKPINQKLKTVPRANHHLQFSSASHASSEQKQIKSSELQKKKTNQSTPPQKRHKSEVGEDDNPIQWQPIQYKTSPYLQITKNKKRLFERV